MTDRSDQEIDRLLSRISRDSEPEEEAPGDERLAELRRGELSEAEAGELAKTLAQSTSLRMLARFEAEPIDDRLRSWAVDRFPRRRRGLPVVIALALAAVLALFALSPRVLFQGELNTSYELEVLGGIQRVRGDARSAEARFTRDSIVEIRGRPSKEMSANRAPLLFVARPEGALARVVGAEIETTKSGRFRIRARAEILFSGETGDHVLYVVVGAQRPEQLAGLRPEAAREKSAGATWLQIPVVAEPSAEEGAR